MGRLLLLSLLLAASCSMPPPKTAGRWAAPGPNEPQLEGYAIPDADLRAILAAARAYLQHQNRSWAVRRVLVHAAAKVEVRLAFAEYPDFERAHIMVERRSGSWEVVGGIALEDIITG